MASNKPIQRHGGKKNRKHRRNYRWDGVDHSVTKYRLRHHIDANAKRRSSK